MITGGSSGIGYGISEKFAEEGCRLLWVSLFADELSEARDNLLKKYPNTEVHTLAKDLSKRPAALEMYNWARTIAPVDVLINNAGFGSYGYLQETDMDRELSMIELNAISPYLSTRYFLNDMLERDSGTIINISSNSSFETVPKLLTYSSTKAFVKHFSRGLQEELKMQKSSVKVITVCPAAIKDTKFKEAGQMKGVVTFEGGLVTTTKDEVVSDIWRAYKKGKEFMVTGRSMRWLYYTLNSLIPFSIKMYLTKKESSRK